MGITGKVYNLLKSSYKDCTAKIKTPLGLTKAFKTTAGVKQGCTLSPTLSNIFQNDIHDIFNPLCDPVALDNFEFNSLSWADDLVLLSKSKAGLQNCLTQLELYCDKWGLQVNEDKTKCMIMSQGTPPNPTFLYNNKVLENVDNYKYIQWVEGPLHAIRSWSPWLHL